MRKPTADELMKQLGMDTPIKACSKCKEAKHVDQFYISKRRGGYWFYPSCIECGREDVRCYREPRRKELAAKQRAYAQEHQEEIRAYNKRLKKENPELVASRKRADYQKHRVKRRIASERWRLANRDHWNKMARKRIRHKRKTDPAFHLLSLMRHQVWLRVRQFSLGKSSARTMELLGCDMQQLRAHFETQFQPGMTWENMGRGGWHIDHKIPCSWFDLTEKWQQELCFHHTNLQPLWEADNLSKSNRFAHE